MLLQFCKYINAYIKNINNNIYNYNKIFKYIIKL